MFSIDIKTQEFNKKYLVKESFVIKIFRKKYYKFYYKRIDLYHYIFQNKILSFLRNIGILKKKQL